MTKVCIKCHYVRVPTDTAPEYECPKCGVIYAKAEAAARGEQGNNQRRVSASSAADVDEMLRGGLTESRVGDIKRTMLLVLVGVAIGGAAIWALVKPTQNMVPQQPQNVIVIRPPQPSRTYVAPTTSEAVPPQAPANDGQEAHERDKLVEQCRNDTASLEMIHSQWTDAVRLASSTARVAASGPVGALQKLRQQLGAMKGDACAEIARQHLLASMDYTLEVFIRFMRNDFPSALADINDIGKDGKSQGRLARESELLYLQEIEAIKERQFRS